MKSPERLILVVSQRMDSNKKEGRQEDVLIRIGQKTRTALGLDNDKMVELWPDGSVEDKIARSKLLTIFKAYSSDIKLLREQGMSEEDILSVGFVTSRTFDAICGNNRRGKSDSIWIADKISETIIGGDPEFMLENEDGSAQYAANVHNFPHNAQLGSDGPLAELRPTPAISVIDFVNNIKTLLNGPLARSIQDYKWIGGCFFKVDMVGGINGGIRNLPIGGHVHIGTPLAIAKKMQNSDQFRIGTHSTIQKILDEFVAIPMMKVDGVDDSCNRRKTSYGVYGDHRVKGPNQERLEYRTLSGQWLTHPKLATAVLGVVKAISHAIFVDIEATNFALNAVSAEKANRYMSFFDTGFTDWDSIEIVRAYGATRSNKEMLNILHDGKMNFTKALVNGFTKNLLGLNTYPLYKTQIDLFCEIISLPKKDLEKQCKDLRASWIEGQDFII